MFSTARASFSACLLVLAACSGAGSGAAITAGAGDLALSEQVSRDLDRYLTFADFPVAFAVSKDGEFGSAVHCPGGRNCGGDWQAELRQLCEAETGGERCYILAEGRDIVWQGRIDKRSGLDLADQDQVVHYVYGNRTTVHGPSEAAGIIIYLPGAGPDDEAADRSDPAVPPFIRDLNARGWDIQRGNIAASLRLNYAPARALINAALGDHLRAQRQRGYRKVVFAGQSAGGFDVLHLAGQADRPDAVIAAAPACCGPRVWEDGKANEWFFRNGTDYYDLLDNLRPTPVALIFFDDDEFETADRGPASTDLLARRSIPHLIINHPDGLNGHGASWNSAFAAQYAGCLHGFLQASARPQTCQAPDRDPADHTWMTTSDDLASTGATPLTSREMRALLPGNHFAGETSQGTAMSITFAIDGNARSDREDRATPLHATYATADDRLCFTLSRRVCSTLYDWSDGTLIFVGESGSITLRVQPGPAPRYTDPTLASSS